jgi:molybdenum cofactor cytidylyltransferase
MTDNDAKPSIAAILLAAGASRRLGRPKQLLDVAGQPLVAHAVKQAIDLCDAGLVVVTGAAGDQVAAALAGFSFVRVHNPDAAEGMGSSIRHGVLASAADADGILLLVCDQPAVDQGHLMTLIDTWRQSPAQVVAARYADTSGVPAIFPASYRARLAALEGQSGARAILAEADNVIHVDMPAAAFDVDTPADVERLERLLAGRSID